MDTLAQTARALVAPGKGILAADESIGTMSKRLEAAGVPANPETRRAYRDLLVTTPGLTESISGVILCDETLRQSVAGGPPFPQACAARGILPGIKVDTGAKPLAGRPGETVTEGLDGLRERLSEYARMGAAFAKWRGVITIAEQLPTPAGVAANAHALARYAALCQEAGIVPIVEPEVLMDGEHTIERCAAVSTETLQTVFAQLIEQGVALEGVVLKPNMIVAGKGHGEQPSAEEVAAATVGVMRRTVPAAVPGIAFLSGGQPPTVATVHLQALQQLGPQPWALTFSYGRALVDPALAAWRGDAGNVGAAQDALAHRARCNAAAAAGRYSRELEPAAA
ncbi:MAG: fructose-bisphosphate aldolase class I [Euzebyales bacterium]|jgi:fructose-bisphosphate aldolase class I|nr:fructose-bisphosphate aldolase class I [Euzebyales bacterium]